MGAWEKVCSSTLQYFRSSGPEDVKTLPDCSVPVDVKKTLSGFSHLPVLILYVDNCSVFGSSFEQCVQEAGLSPASLTFSLSPEPRASWVLRRHASTELFPRPFFTFDFEALSC